MALTLADLLKPKTYATLLGEMLVSLDGLGLRTTNWRRGAPYLLLLQAESKLLEVLHTLVSQVAAGCHLDSAAGGWLTLLAQSLFGEEREPAVFCEGQVAVWNAAPYPQTIQPGALQVSSGSLKYSSTNATPIAIPAYGLAGIPVKAQSPGASYNVGPGAIVQLDSPTLLGMSVSNPSATPLMFGTSTACVIVTALATGVTWELYDPGVSTPVCACTVVAKAVRVTLARSVGAITATAAQVLAAVLAQPAARTLVDVQVLSAGAGVVSAVGPVVMPFQGNWIDIPGAEEERDERLRERCRSKWGTLGTGSPASAWIYWALKASSAVTKVLPAANYHAMGYAANWITLFLASDTGGVAAGVVTAVDTAVRPHLPLGWKLEVLSALVQTVTITATIYVRREYLTDDLRAQILANLQDHQASLPIGGVEGRVYLSQVCKILGGGADPLRSAQLAVHGVEHVVIASPSTDPVLAFNEAALLVPALTWVGV